ncbi:glucans biosynthesis glucosyltransferase MdoH [Ancylobacter dichloromethanicus]|uniref:Glucans biosynthesis glucosyltransferase H n=1 Tax=Ancylobacter dichloromethanicus TaxID=518825 RepID=A0A9W6MZT4_9HYPH|nr:glucans biosynthesis glucosyltransferase MdoH [Ancylobacter dichloromethanicus]MBS7555903.1 glucans biosynthesis glucosyltransferase MdoH [Ancylobacter dichloromethanicus]GLK72446.1 glucosyltransferase [Ancylobacter dichloromethanicus]
MSLNEKIAEGLPPAAEIAERRTPTGVQSLRQLFRRRAFVLTLNAATYAGLVALFAQLLGHGGFTLLDGLLLAAFCLSTPWTILGFWNALIGLWLLHGPGDARASVYPYAGRAADDAPITARVAVVMTLRNEDPERAFARLRAMQADLAAAGAGGRFAWFVLSDTTDPAIAAAEERIFAAWRASLGEGVSLSYRRRLENTGFKAGNIRDFLERWGDAHDFMLVLDADSLIGASTMLRLVRVMQANPRLGILQSLVVGLPSRSPFARIFQFGMRHGMRSYTMGASWWAGDCGPYWGHNAVIRIAPFKAHCALPVLPGRGPLAGHILSHDQIEAVLMRRAGYEVRVLPEEMDSFEENPPHLTEFTRRDLRWCQGNMQYWRLIAMPGLKPMSRFQIAWAILMYVGAFAWIAFIALAALKVFDTGRSDAPFPVELGITLFVATFLMSLAPKLAGLADVLLRPGERQRYGGTGRLLGGALAEFLFSVLLGPVVAFRIALFMVGLAFGRTVTWEAQSRDATRLSWRTAFAGLWPQLLFGSLLGGLLWVFAPAALLWALPVLVGLLGAVPFAVLTSEPALGRWLARAGLCATPEELQPTGRMDWTPSSPALATNS